MNCMTLSETPQMKRKLIAQRKQSLAAEVTPFSRLSSEVKYSASRYSFYRFLAVINFSFSYDSSRKDQRFIIQSYCINKALVILAFAVASEKRSRPGMMRHQLSGHIRSRARSLTRPLASAPYSEKYVHTTKHICGDPFIIINNQ